MTHCGISAITEGYEAFLFSQLCVVAAVLTNVPVQYCSTAVLHRYCHANVWSVTAVLQQCCLSCVSSSTCSSSGGSTSRRLVVVVIVVLCSTQ